MSVIRNQREKVAKTIGADLANEIIDTQLPALLHAIEADELEVRVCAQRVTRSKDVDNPAALLMWLLRERKYAEPVKIAPTDGPRGPRNVPAAMTPEEFAIQRHRAMDWKRIWLGIKQHADFAEIWHDMQANQVDATIVRHTLIAVLDDMQQQQEAHAQPQN